MKFKAERIEGSLLAGVCAGIAQAFQWNVWVLRALFVVFLMTKTLWAVIAYAVLAVIFILFDDRLATGPDATESLSSPELSARNQRIADLEQRFRDLENGH